MLQMIVIYICIYTYLEIKVGPKSSEANVEQNFFFLIKFD